MPSTLKYPGTVTADADWTNPNNIKAEDGAVAQSSYWVTKGGSGNIAGSNFGFSLPSTVIIDGIQVDVKFSGTNLGGETVILSNNGGSKTATRNISQNPGSLTWVSIGGPTDMWGQAWTYSDLNNSGFNALINAFASHSPADAVMNIDAVRITVFYHIGLPSTPTEVPTRELYKVRNQSGIYIGNLPQPTEILKIAQDINSLGSQITINVPISADVAGNTTEPYTVEDASENYTTEDGVGNYTTEGALPIVSPGINTADTLIKNGNTIECWIYNYWYPNGKCMFVGKIRRWGAKFGGDDNVTVVCYSNGYDMDNYITRGAPFNYTSDQSQTSQDTIVNIFQNDKGGGWFLYGQTWTPGAGVTNLGAITLLLQGTAQVTVNVYDQPNGGTLLGSSTQNVANGSAAAVQFGFPALITVQPGTQYFFEVRPASGQSINVYLQNSNVYANGTALSSSYGGGGGGAYGAVNQDLYFVTASGTPSTTATFTSKDPTIEMLAPIISDYNLRGGTQQWTALSIDATGLSLTYTFNVQTIYEALQAILSLCPDGFYYYVDLGTQTIYFKNQSTTADFTFTKGVHINELELITTTENSINQLLFTGGDGGSGVNLYKQYTDPASIAAFGPLLNRKTDNRVTVDATANAIGVSTIAQLSGEQYQTTVTILHTTSLDITLLVPGKTVAFRGFGTYVDTILAQIVHREWTTEAVTLTLGILPTRLTYEFENTTRQLIAQQTQDNPGTPT